MRQGLILSERSPSETRDVSSLKQGKLQGNMPCGLCRALVASTNHFAELVTYAGNWGAWCLALHFTVLPGTGVAMTACRSVEIRGEALVRVTGCCLVRAQATGGLRR